MLSKRIIPCLDIKNGRTVKGTNFVNLRDAGDPVERAKIYCQQGADELVFLDISATQEERSTLVDLVQQLSAQLNIPFTVGGGIASCEDMERLFHAGADKCAINSAAVKNPQLIYEASQCFGSQAVVVAIDAKKVGPDKWNVFTRGGTHDTQHDVIEWIQTVQDRGAGEILLTSMEKDGTTSGFDCELLRAVKPHVRVPIIASGGAKDTSSFVEIFESDLANAGLAASIFHFQHLSIPELKNALAHKNIPIRNEQIPL